MENSERQNKADIEQGERAQKALEQDHWLQGICLQASEDDPSA